MHKAFLFANDLPCTHTCKYFNVCVYINSSHTHRDTREAHTHTHEHTQQADSHNDDTYLILIFFQSRLRIICEFSAFIVIQLNRNQFEFTLEFKVGGNAVSFTYKWTKKTAPVKAEKNKKK